MVRVAISGGLLLADAAVQCGLAWHGSNNSLTASVLVLGGIGLLWSVNHFASELFASMTGHEETFRV